MRILVTGGSGFIGRNLVEMLSSRHEVQSPSSRELDLCEHSDVRRYLSAQRFDAVIHCATWDATATSAKERNRVLECNLRMFFNIANCSGEYGKLIHFGSGAEFSREHWEPQMSEDYLGRHIPTDQYGLSKYVIAQYTEAVQESIYNLRLFGVFGKYENWRIRFISQSCCRVLADRPITINQNVRFDYLYVEDLAPIVQWFLLNEPSHKTYNICSGRVHELYDLAQMVAAQSKEPVEIRFAAGGMGREYSGDNRRMSSELGEVNFTDMREAVASLFKWYQTNPSYVEWSEVI